MHRTSLGFGVAVVLLVLGCTPGHLVTRGLEEPLAPPVVLLVGSFLDRMPLDTPDRDKPSAETIESLKAAFRTAIEAHEGFALAGPDDDARYELRGAILDYQQGSGALRFFLGFSSGTARTIAELHLVDVTDGSRAFSGNFVGEVTSWAETGDAMFTRMAKDFCTTLDDQREALTDGG